MARFIVTSEAVGGKSPPANDGQNVAVSTDGGATWSLALMPVSGQWASACWNGTSWCAITSSGVSACSSDGGATWTSGGTVPTPPGTIWVDLAAHGGTGRVVAVGENGSTAFTDDGGATWESGGDIVSTTGWRSIACNGRVFCAVGMGVGGAGFAAVSADGTSWATYPVAQNTGSPMGMGKIITVTGSGRFVVGNYTPSVPVRLQYSDDDGQTWTLSGSIGSTVHSMNCMACDGHSRVLVGDTDGYVGVSNDGGTTFSEHTDPLVYGSKQSSPVGIFSSFSCDGDQFVLMRSGTSDYAVTTPDGITYTARTLPAQAKWYQVASDVVVIASLAVVPSSASMALGVGVPTVASSSVLVDVAAASMQLYAGTPLVSASMRLDVASASMLLAAGVPHVSTGAVSAFKSTDGSALPLKVWNGSGWVDVPLRLWDGSTFLN